MASYWHRNVWFEAVSFPAASIGAAAEGLRSLGALWTARPQDQFRRHELVREKLPRFQPKPRSFPFSPPVGSLGVWALRDENTVWASPRAASPFPGGDPLFVENKTDPPSSAYLKLQEALVLFGRQPVPGEVCLDAGSSPGGWTWVLAERGATVHSVDRAPLDERLTKRANVFFRTGNAFSLQPQDFEPLDWFCCDVICYPQKLWNWLQPWLASATKRFVVTVKMQGRELDWETLDRFDAVPGSRLVHLHHNKHELTWLYDKENPWPRSTISLPSTSVSAPL